MWMYGLDRAVKGYDVEAVYRKLEEIRKLSGAPSVLILDTWKGAGCCFAEEQPMNHYMTVTMEMAEEAIAEIERRLANGSFPTGGRQW